jgi:hypothetical protein
MNPEAFCKLVQAEALKRGLSETQAVEALWAFAALHAKPGTVTRASRARRPPASWAACRGAGRLPRGGPGLAR